MIEKQNLHTHSSYCDGKDTPEELVLYAINSGFSSIGFSGHISPKDYTIFGYTEDLDIKKGLELAMEFEILYLKNKATLYEKMASDDIERIKMMEKRLEVIRSM